MRTMEEIATSANVTRDTCSLTNLEPTPFSLMDVDVFVVFLTKANCHVAFGNYKWALAIAIDLWIVTELCRAVITHLLLSYDREAWKICKRR